MERFKSYLYANKEELKALFLLLIVYVIFALVFAPCCGKFLIDCGREAYIPQQMLHGKVLYKDIFNIFGPLSYQITAILYKIFGINLNVLFVAGTLNAGLIIFLIYFLSRFFTSKSVSFAIAIFCIVSCVFSHDIGNYILPYTYAIVYAISAGFLSVLFLLLSLKYKESRFIPVSWFFLGVSLTSKYEFVFYAIFLFFFTVFVLKPGKKYLFLSLISFLAVPFLSFVSLFLQGLTVQDLGHNLSLVLKYSKSHSLNYFYGSYVGLYPKFDSALFYLNYFLKAALVFIGVFIPLYVFLEKRLFSMLLFPVITAFIMFYINYNLNIIFCWIAIFAFITFMILLFNQLKSRLKLNLKEYFGTKDGLFLLFVFVSLLITFKTNAYVNFAIYGTYTFPLLFIIFTVMLVEYIPNRIKLITKKSWHISFVISILFLMCFYLYILGVSVFGKKPIITNKGIMNDKKIIVEPFLQEIDYIDRNLKPEDSIWVLPEGVMLNFLTDHPTVDVNYINVTPPYLETFGEDNIISEIKKNPPDYIIINNRELKEYGYRSFCEDTGLKICSYVKSDYKFEKIFYKASTTGNFEVSIFKHGDK